MEKRYVTVVFEVRDTEAFKDIYQSHMQGQELLGAYPEIIARGDAVTVPGEITDRLHQLDSDGFQMQNSESDDRTLLRELISMADEYINKQS